MLAEPPERAVRPRYLNIKQLAVLLGVSTKTIQRWRQKNVIPQPAVKRGSRCYWTRHQIEMMDGPPKE